MKVRSFALIALFCIASIARAHATPSGITGTWSIQPAFKGEGVNLEFQSARDSQQKHSDHMSSDIDIARLGLTRAEIDGRTTSRTFALTAEAGKIDFAGAVGEGVGAGHFTFVPSPEYESRLVQNGFNRPDTEELFVATIFDISSSYIGGMARVGYPTKKFENLITFRVLGITPESAKALQSAFGPIDAHHLITFAALHITPSYAAELRSVGISGLNTEGLIELKSMAIDAGYVRSLASEGYPRLRQRDIVQFKALKIDSNYLESLASVGYKGLSVHDVIQLKALGVSKIFIERMHAHGFKNLTVSELIRLKVAGL